MIELRHFRQFVAVAEELNFRRAATRLNMAQPPLTAAIRKIEESVGARLIERSNRIERLTAAGEAFLLEARRAIAQAERAIRVAKRVGNGETGTLRLSFVASAARDILPRTLRAFRAHHSEIELELQEATTAQQITFLLQDRVDIGIVVLPPPGIDDLNVVTLSKSHLMAALPTHHPAVAKERVSLSELASEPWILFPARQGPGLHQLILSACGVAGYTPRVIQEAVQMETIVGLVAGGLGVSLVPPSVAQPGRADVAFRTLTGRGAPVAYELALVFSRQSSLVDAFIRCAATTAAGDGDSQTRHSLK